MAIRPSVKTLEEPSCHSLAIREWNRTLHKNDPLDDLVTDDVGGGEIPPVPDDYEFTFPLVSKRSREDLEAFELNVVDDYRDFKHDLLAWLAAYGKSPERREGLARTTLESTHYKRETAERFPINVALLFFFFCTSEGCYR